MVCHITIDIISLSSPLALHCRGKMYNCPLPAAAGDWVAQWLSDHMLQQVGTRLCDAAAAQQGSCEGLAALNLSHVLHTHCTQMDYQLAAETGNSLPDAGSTAVLALLLQPTPFPSSSPFPPPAFPVPTPSPLNLDSNTLKSHSAAGTEPPPALDGSFTAHLTDHQLQGASLASNGPVLVVANVGNSRAVLCTWQSIASQHPAPATVKNMTGDEQEGSKGGGSAEVAGANEQALFPVVLSSLHEVSNGSVEHGRECCIVVPKSGSLAAKERL